MMINKVVFAKNEVLSMVMKRAWYLFKGGKFFTTATKGDFKRSLKKAWEEIKSEIAYEMKTINHKVVSYYDYKNNPAYKGLKTVKNSYNARKKEITVILNSIKTMVCKSCGHNDIIDGYCVDCSSKVF